MPRSSGSGLARVGAKGIAIILITNTTRVVTTGMAVITARTAETVTTQGTAAKKHFYAVLRGHSKECAKALIAFTSGGNEVK